MATTPRRSTISLRDSCCLTEGEFEPALKEFEAAGGDLVDSFLHFRLAQLYLRGGDLRKALGEAESAVRLEPKSVDYRFILAGLYSRWAIMEGRWRNTTRVVTDSSNQEALLYAGALYLQVEDYARATRHLDEVVNDDNRLG